MARKITTDTQTTNESQENMERDLEELPFYTKRTSIRNPKRFLDSEETKTEDKLKIRKGTSKNKIAGFKKKKLKSQPNLKTSRRKEEPSTNTDEQQCNEYGMFIFTCIFYIKIENIICSC
ncbi:hypothetical protein WN55_03462 [Dufourea novaeangliae]|uniref:Uncharacterized protein n=1 Tax=Dufourea novaeangliae TaxID=178035 RepID=A0A154PKZ3_DUFNO|nr:hypothetical protein WN55_03462 [Dufourea novaeangliae]